MFALDTCASPRDGVARGGGARAARRGERGAHAGALTFHCKCLLKYLAQCSVQQEHTYIDDATYKLNPSCPSCRTTFSVKGVQRELRSIAFDRSA